MFLSMFVYLFLFFFFKQKTAYEMRISDWSSDVCSSDLHEGLRHQGRWRAPGPHRLPQGAGGAECCRNHREFLAMMNVMMSGGEGLIMWGMGIFWLLVFVVLVLAAAALHRKSVVWGQRVSIGVAHGVRRRIKKKKNK